MREKQILQSELHLNAGVRSYNFEIRQASDGTRHLIIDEMQASLRNRIVVYEEYWQEFLSSLRVVMDMKTQVKESDTWYLARDSLAFEQLDALVSDAYGKRTRIRTLLKNAGLDLIQSGYIIQHHSQDVAEVVLENFRDFLHSRQSGELLWKIILQRYGLAGSAPETYQAIAEKLNVSPEDGQQIVEQALRRLRLQQRRRRLEASLRAHADEWLSGQVVEKPEPSEQGAGEEKLTPEYVLNTRAIYPRAFEPWSAEEETRLVSLYQDGYPIDELAEHFSRQPGAIRSRLRKLHGEGD